LVVGGNARDWQTSGAMLLLLLFHVPASLAGVSNVSASASSTCSCLRCSGVSFACKQQETHKHTHTSSWLACIAHKQHGYISYCVQGIHNKRPCTAASQGLHVRTLK
jgi:hypothetical protein